MRERRSAAARHARASELFLAALEHPPEERAAWLDRACGDDRALRRAVDTLMRHDAPPAEALDTPAGLAGLPSVDTLAAQASVPVPHAIDGHRVLGLLGSGGAGVVYRVRQEHPPRELALKLLHPALADPAMRRRFEREAQILARLSHPGIAQIHGAGEFDGDGAPRPYLLMELVHGRPLTRYAREERLGLRDRVALLERVCDALAHAHDHGVVHRDLKAANVLVMESGQPKIVDFGAARLLAAAGAGEELTRVGQVVGSLATMSPEQLDAAAGGVDRRADVHALGVLAFELLAGRPPYDLRGRSVSEALAVLRGPRPRLGRVDRRLRGDLEAIVSQAMAPERADRYDDARALAADLAAWRAGRPVRARRPGRSELAWRAVRAHPLLVALGLGLLAAGALLAEHEARVARERAAEAAFYRAAHADIGDFLSSMPTAALPGDETVMELLSRARPVYLELVRTDAARASLFASFVARSLRVRFGEQRELAEEFYGHAVEQAERAWGPTHAQTLQARRDQLDFFVDQGLLDAAGASLASLRERCAGLPQQGPFRLRLAPLEARYLHLIGEHEARRALLESVAPHVDAVLGGTDPDAVTVHMALAVVEIRDGERARGDAIVARLERELGGEHPLTRKVQLNWMRALAARLDAPAPRELAKLQERLAARRATYDDRDPGVIDLVLELVLHHQRRDEHAEALRWARLEPLDCTLEELGALQAAVLARHQGVNLIRLERQAEAEAVLVAALDALGAGADAAPTCAHGLWLELARARLQDGRAEAARDALERADALAHAHGLTVATRPGTRALRTRIHEAVEAAPDGG